jgi:hypothetical protein
MKRTGIMTLVPAAPMRVIYIVLVHCSILDEQRQVRLLDFRLTIFLSL